MSIFNYKKCSN